MDFDLSQYMSVYVDSSRENLDLMDKQLLALEQNPGDLEAVSEIFRAAHTLKGMSATMGFEKVAHLTHEMENILDKLRNGSLKVHQGVIDVIFETFDALRILVNDTIASTNSNVDLDAITAKLGALHNEIGGGAPAPAAAGHEAVAAATPEPAAAAAPTAAPTAAISLSEFALSPYELQQLMDGQSRGMTTYLLHVQLVRDCLLKAPRVFMVNRNLADLKCEIFKAHPELKELEEEKFDFEFKMIIVGEAEAEAIKNSIESISEISIADVTPFSPEDFGPDAAARAPAAAPAPVPAAAPAPKPAAPAAAPAVAPRPAAPATPAAAPVAAAAPVETPPAVAPAPHPGDGGGDAPAATPVVEKAKEEPENLGVTDLVSFTMVTETYALDISLVEGIINYQPVTRVPKAPAYVEGVINLRGEVIPVINLAQRLRLIGERKAQPQIIILTFEEQKIKVGFCVDSVHEVLRLPAEAIEPPSHVSDSVDVSYLKGVGKIERRLIIILDAAKIVFSDPALNVKKAD